MLPLYISNYSPLILLSYFLFVLLLTISLTSKPLINIKLPALQFSSAKSEAKMQQKSTQASAGDTHRFDTARMQLNAGNSVQR